MPLRAMYHPSRTVTSVLLSKGSIMLKGFKDFILRGNIVELAIAVVIGTAFTALVGAFTSAIIEPLIAAVAGADSIGLGFSINGQFVDIGAVINAAITFAITAAVVYFVFVVPMNKISERRKRGMQPVNAAPTDSELLTEIRDLLRVQNEGRKSL